MKNKVLFSTVITLESIIIIALIINYFSAKNRVLGTVNVNPIQKDNLVTNKNSDLKHFLEPKANISDEQVIVGAPDLKAKYNINSDSLNEQFDYSLEKNPKTYRIVSIGDSFTFGMFVNTPDNYPEQLEKILSNLNCTNLNRFEVINLGVIGYDIQYAVERYRLRGQKYHPDLLIWLLKNDDFSQIAELLNPEVDSFISKNYTSFNEKTMEWPAIQKALDKVNSIYGFKRIFDMQKNYLKSIRKYYSGEILFILIPGKSEYKNLLNDFIKRDKKSSLLIIDRITDADLHFIDTHPNEKGYRVLANEIYNFLQVKKMFSCN